MFSNYRELKAYVEREGIETLDFKITELAGGWRHLTIPVSRMKEEIFEQGYGFDGSNYGYAPVEDSDMVWVPDLTTAFLDPFWKEKTLSFLGKIMVIGDELTPFSGDTRGILQRSLEYMKGKGVADSFVVGPEYEFYIFDEVDYWNEPLDSGFSIRPLKESGEEPIGIGHKAGYHIDSPHDLNRDLRVSLVKMLEDLGVLVKYHHHEVGGPGQHEIELLERGAHLMGDACMITKYVIKNYLYSQGRRVTFMPKPIFGEAGNGFHVHMQLFKDGKSLFAGPDDNYAGLSKVALHFLGGILVHTPALMALTAPSTNSYRRLVRGYEAPVAICFARANRSAVVRVPAYATKPQKRRYEFRSSDCTCNPYLLISSLLMAGLDGVMRELDPFKEGFKPLEKNIYALTPEEEKKITFLPSSLEEALDELKKDNDFLLEGGVYTKEFIQDWINKKEKEINFIKELPHPGEFELYMDF